MTVSKEDSQLVIPCTCGDLSHMYVFTYYHDDTDPDLILSVHLNPESPWYKRVWRAITYIFGVRSKYGDFADVILDDYDMVLFIHAYLSAIMQRWPKDK